MRELDKYFGKDKSPDRDEQALLQSAGRGRGFKKKMTISQRLEKWSFAR